MKANVQQETQEWMDARAGAFTASRSGDLMAKTRSGPSASRANLIARLAVERLTGHCVSTFQSAAMARGVEMEAEARDAYSFLRGVVVDEVGYVQHPTIPYCGASPDGLIGDDGLLEVKCPSSEQKHVEALRNGGHATEYRWQLQHQLMVTGREWVDAVSYHPEFPGWLPLAVTRVQRDDEAIRELIDAITEAEQEVQAIVDELKNMKEPA